jgi:hypothetical protein
MLTCHSISSNRWITLAMHPRFDFQAVLFLLQQNRKYKAVHSQSYLPCLDIAVRACIHVSGNSTTISRWRFNPRAHWCERHCWVVLSYFCFTCYFLWAAVAIEPSSGASISVPVNSLQLARSGNIPMRFVSARLSSSYVIFKTCYRSMKF